MDFLAVQFLTGLAGASSLFLVASGLSIIFGVTRIVNFAHGAFYMLGAYIAYSLTERWSGALGFWGGLIAAALAVAVIGALVEIVLLRRIYRAPELFQLLATFGVTLVVQDLSVIIWGPEDLVGRRAPGFRHSVEILGQSVPSYDLLLIALGPLVLASIWLLFHRTRFGVLVRAATQDRDMVAALGVNQRWLFTGVFALGVFLAALGGALQLPRDAVSHTMDLRIIVEVFVVVVIGGLGSVGGAYLAALLVSELNAFGILIMPTISLVVVFLVMAIVLVVRPHGLFGKPEGPPRATPNALIRPWRPFSRNEQIAVAIAVLAAALLPLVAGSYVLSVGTEIFIVALFAASLQLIMSAGGIASFGHAAYFGLGAYGAALAAKSLALPFPAALAAGVALGAAGAAIFGWFCVRLSGVYFAMLTLAFAQIAWSIAFQWTSVTGGDNGLLGIWPPSWAANPAVFYWIALGLAVFGVAAIRAITFSPFGYALRAVRDSALRAESIGIGRRGVQWTAFVVAGAFAALAGAMFAYLKGSVFPDNLGIPLSVDGLVMVLLGGVETVSGAVVGAIVYRALSIVLMSQTDYSKLVLGLFIVTLVVAFPRGIVGSLQGLVPRLRGRAAAPMGHTALRPAE
ncbi:MAG: transporter permease [Enterovirga sp.]|nr:transporter permease [Enterovirga sp.]